MSDHNNSCGCGDRSGRICCDVSSCVYNDKNRCCTAHMIEVAPDGGEHGSAASSDETCCRTFRRS